MTDVERVEHNGPITNYRRFVGWLAVSVGFAGLAITTGEVAHNGLAVAELCGALASGVALTAGAEIVVDDIQEQ